MKPKCPGQDSRYWKPDAVCMAPCPACGKPVEFFKDDRSRRCPHCHKRFKNPRLNLECAKWCIYARECVDYKDGQQKQPEDPPRQRPS